MGSSYKPPVRTGSATPARPRRASCLATTPVMLQRPSTLRRSGLAAPLTGLAACDGARSALDPAGPAAGSIETMWWVLFWVCTVVFAIVMAALGAALLRSAAERRRVLGVLLAGAAISAVILAGIFLYTMVGLEDIGPTAAGGAAEVTVIVTGKQYWWDVRYPLPSGDTVVSANEIHIPVGRRVDLLLRSDDVIHSLRVPLLHGETDMIPGRTNRAWLLADSAGIYRGHCGQQHTWMALYVVARPEGEFRGWLERQRRPAAPVAPAPDAVDQALDHPPPPGVPDSVRAAALARNARIRRGREVFLDPDHRCAECHVVRGETDVGGLTEGPDLTHVASRLSLAAGRLDMNRGNMGGWISNPQVLKPGNLMPRVPLEPEEMNALLEYLMSLR